MADPGVITPPTKLGRYEIVGELAHGAMGTVYKAIDPLIERTVALKTIPLDLSRQEHRLFEARFHHEAKSAGRLNHPNIVTVYDAGETSDTAYIAMEYLEGESLDVLLDRQPVLPPHQAAHIALQIANGLAYAHRHGVVHRDIKPTNIILMRRGGVVKITDFGIAHITGGSPTQVGALLGSPRYMSPEQVQGKPVDGRSDIFSLGVVLYEMLTGATPVCGDNLNAILYAILHHDPAPPSCINPALPPGFDHIVARALAKLPHERYQHVRDMAADLRTLRGLEQPVTPTAVEPGPDTLAQQTRNADRALLGILGTLASLGVAIIAVLAAVAVLVSSNIQPPAGAGRLHEQAVLPVPTAHPAGADTQPGASTPSAQGVAPALASPRQPPHPNSVAIAALEEKIQTLKIKRAELLTKYTELHPDVVIATRQIQRLEKEKRRLARE